MSSGFFIHVGTLALTLFVVASACLEVFRAIRQDPKDRVLVFEAVAFITFFLGLALLKVVGVSWLSGTVWLTSFFASVALAAYFGLRNWMRRRKRTS